MCKHFAYTYFNSYLLTSSNLTNRPLNPALYMLKYHLLNVLYTKQYIHLLIKTQPVDEEVPF